MLWFVNYWILQFFFIRLALIVDKYNHSHVYGWEIIGPIMPFTGWKSDYVFINKSVPRLESSDSDPDR